MSITKKNGCIDNCLYGSPYFSGGFVHLNKRQNLKINITSQAFNSQTSMKFPSVISLLFILLSYQSVNAQEVAHSTIDQKLDALRLDKKDIEIYIDKTTHTLSLRIGRTLLKQYKCVFGPHPLADKKYEGDKCTPEGEFHIQAKRPHAEWDKIMLIDYPTRESWQKFEANKAMGIIPSSATIGGGIGIHGVPKNKHYLIDKNINWTLGCISLTNEDIEEIYRYADIGTKVTIVK